MSQILAAEQLFFQALLLAMLLVKLWALIDAASRRADAFEAANRLTKQAWLLLTGLAFLADLLIGGLGILGFIGIIIALVYLLDVRPAVRRVTPPRR